jgi:tetratricopeptide (TPR) repeat protein
MPENLHFTETLEKEPVAVLTRYLEGDLSVEEIQQLEQVMAEDPFIADALEGLRTMPEPARAHAIGQELKFKAHKLLRAKRPIISLYHFNQYATAAVAVLVILFVATAAIMLTSRIQERPAKEVTVADAVTEKPTAEAEEALIQNPETPDPKPETTPLQEPKKDLKPENQREIAANTSPKITKPTPATVPKESISTPPTFDKETDVFTEEQVAEDQNQHTAGSVPVTVESYEEITADPTLSNEQLESYNQALTKGELIAYQDALGKLERSLSPMNNNAPVISTQAGRADAEELERKERKREKEAKKNAASKDSRMTDSMVKTEDQVDRDRRNQEAEVDMGYDDFEINENLLKQQLYANPTDGENWLNLGKYYMEQNQNLKAEPYLKGAARSSKLSVVQEANALLKKIQE